ncbi:MAG: hypothetical protein ACE5H3_01315 [Planctomycetota bacterium]
MIRLACLLLSLTALAETGSPQKAVLGKRFFTDNQNGYRFRFPQDWKIIPVRAGEQALGILAQLEGPSLATRSGNRSISRGVSLTVAKILPRRALTGPATAQEGVQENAGGEESPPAPPQDVAELINTRFRREFTLDQAEVDETRQIPRGPSYRHRLFSTPSDTLPMVFDAWSFSLPDYEVVLLFSLPREHLTDWQKVFYLAARSFRTVERVEAAALPENPTYEDLLAYHREEVSRTPGWRLLETPSKRYLIKTSSRDDRFLKRVIARLEASRNLFEKEYPPSRPMDQVSVVRVCSSPEEFHHYGKTGGGVAGWFNPATTELVIVDFKNSNRNLTYSVMTHEAFHQYCYFLFDRAEAHRWFDEGHGDYYAGFEFRGNQAIPHAKMKGQDRLAGIRRQIREGTCTPLAELIRSDHPTWQKKGVASYEESWSLIYYLHQGMDGRVPGRIWRKEYSAILPAYIEALYEGFQTARKKSPGGEVTEEQKKEIWKQALTASWGNIDLPRFEESWKYYVVKVLK